MVAETAAAALHKAGAVSPDFRNGSQTIDRDQFISASRMVR
jgi:hypothetical protein